MNQTIIWKALIGAVITLGTTLITLFSGDGVVNFSDISPVQYAVAVIGAVLAAASVLQAALTDSPAQSMNKQGGFASPNFLLIVAIACIVLAMFGCSATPKPLNTIAAASVAIEQMALQIDLAQKSGQISNEREDKLLGDLQNLNQQLRIASSLTSSEQRADLESINAQLIELRAELAKEQGK